MSKMDGLRAMREARYAENTARASTAAKTTAPTTAPTAKKAPARPAVKKAAPSPTPDNGEASEPALCGHRNMSGRTCTREHGHAAKSHRYS